MREELTDTFRRMLEHAQTEARRLNQEFVSSEHLLIGILHCDDCEASRALRTQHIDTRALRAAMLDHLPRGEQDPVITGQLPLSPRAQRAVNSAIVRAQSLRESRVSTRLVLLSMLDEPQTLLRQILRDCGADMDVLLHKLAQKPQSPED